MKKIVLAVLLLLLSLSLLFLTIYRYSFFYYPDKQHYGRQPDTYGIPYQNIYFYSKDGTKLHGWYIPALTTATVQPIATVIHVHGNAGNMTTHWPFVKWLPLAGYNVFMFDYRGYGESEGVPNPQGLMEDTQSAINYVSARPDVDASKLVLFGQSLGGNNAIAVVGYAQHLFQSEQGQLLSADDKAFWQQSLNIKALFIDSTFYSYAAIANDKIPAIGALIYDSDNYSAANFITKISQTPIMFIHSKGDQVIPYSHSEWLYQLANSPKQLQLIDGGSHLSAMLVPGLKYKHLMSSFFEQALMNKRPAGIAEKAKTNEVTNNELPALSQSIEP